MRKLLALFAFITYSGFAFATDLPNGFVVSAVIADGQFVTNGSMTNGGTTLTSASNPFVAGDVGKTLACGGTAAAGGLQTGTVSAYNSPGSVGTSFAAGATISGSATCQWGTDNTTTINNAITGLTNGGTVLLPTGYIMVSSLNMANSVSVGLIGTSCGINASDRGTVLVPTTSTNNRAMIDLIGAQGARIECLQINTTRTPVAPGAAIFVGNSSVGYATLMNLKNVFATGYFQNATLYAYGIQDSYVENSSFWMYTGALFGQSTGQVTAFLSRDNTRGMGSSYATIATGSQLVGNILFNKGEMHEYKPTGGSSYGSAVYLRGAGAMSFNNYLLDSSSSNLGVVYSEQSTDGSNTNRTVFIGSTLYTENGTAAAACIKVGSGSMTNTTIINASFTCTTPRVGTVTYLGLQTP